MSESEAVEEYFTLADMRVLERLEHPVYVGDWTKGQKKWHYVNKAGLEVLGLTMNQMLSMEMNTGQSQGTDDYQSEIWAKVQCAKQRLERVKTVYPKGVPVSAVQISKHIPFKLPNEGTPRNLLLQEFKVLDDGHLDTAIAAEMNLQSEIIALSFDAQSQRLEHANQKARTFYDLGLKGDRSADHLQIRSLHDLLSNTLWRDESQKEELHARIAALTLSSQRIQVECELAMSGKKDTIWHMFYFIPAPNPLNGRLMVIVNQHDVTMQHLQSEQLLATKAQEQFVSAVSHELRTPLNGIIGLSDSLLHSPDCTPRIAKMVEQVKGSGVRLAEMVDDIIDAASASKGEIKLKYETLNLQQVASQVCDSLMGSCQRGVDLRCSVSEALLVDGDSVRVTQVLSKLVSNATKFTSRGSITVSARVLEDDEVAVEVTDTGVGIPRDKWKRIWSPFTQLDMSSTRNHGGTGLGLSLVKKLVEAHGGRVGLKSRCGGADSGSVFFFIVPRRQPSRSIRPHAPDSQPKVNASRDAEADALRGEVETLHQQLRDKSADLARMCAQVSALEAQLAQSRDAAARAQRELAQLRSAGAAPQRSLPQPSIATGSPLPHGRSHAVSTALNHHLLAYLEIQEEELQQREALHRQQHAASATLTRTLLDDMQSLVPMPLLAVDATGENRSRVPDPPPAAKPLFGSGVDGLGALQRHM